MGANFQQGFLCTVRAATSSYFARSQLWCAPGVKPGGRGASSSGGIDRKGDTWVATGRMQSGFQGILLLCMIPLPSRSSGYKGRGALLRYKNQQLSCLCERGLELPSHWTGRGKDTLLHSMWTQLEVTLDSKEARTSYPFPGHSWVGQGMHHGLELDCFELAPEANSGQAQGIGHSLAGVKPDGEGESWSQLQSTFPRKSRSQGLRSC